MRWLYLVLMALALALVVGVVVSVSADDVYKPSNADEKVDLPVPKPTRPTGWEEEDAEEGEGDEVDEDDEDDDENPPIEFFDEEIEGDKVVYQLDYTGSMMGKVGHSIVDENGRKIGNPSKMQHIKAEFARSVLALSENVRFSVVMFATPAWQ